MSSNKYADLPDIDTAPDIYETEDVFPSFRTNKEDDSDDDVPSHQRSPAKARSDAPTKDEIDSSSLIDPELASQRFRKAKLKSHHLRTYYGYPPSPTEDSLPNARSLPLSQRLKALQEELGALEMELADPSNPRLVKEREVDNVDPGELIRGLVDVRKRVDKIRKRREGRAKLIGVLLGGAAELSTEHAKVSQEDRKISEQEGGDRTAGKLIASTIVEMDQRIAQVEKLVGSSTVALNETSPLPPPLLPLISKLNAQLTLFTQPRHIDSITRRLKLLLSDWERASNQHYSHRRHPSQPGNSPQSSQLQEQILPLLSRVVPSLTNIPHILTRLRTLAALHTSASEFQERIQSLETRQQHTYDALNELETAVKTVETSLEENHSVVRGNIAGLESRIDSLLTKLELYNRDEAT